MKNMFIKYESIMNHILSTNIICTIVKLNFNLGYAG